MPFPQQRPMRYRKSAAIRASLRETHVSPDSYIYPLFIDEGLTEKEAVSAMPGVYRHSQTSLLEEVREAVDLGIRAVLLFGIPREKDPGGRQVYARDGVIQSAVRKLRDLFPDLLIYADCCLCDYTDHGGCMVAGKDQDATLDVLARTARSYAEAGVDFVAPSGMIDGMVQEIRRALDKGGFSDVGILSYAVKYASALYGPFREAAGSAFSGSRDHHQMAVAQRREAMIEAKLDVDEGADMLMVKPGTFYLDIVRDLRERFDCPIAVYQVSGEYAMVKTAGSQGLVDEKQVLEEAMLAFRRAGADLIVTYAAKEMAARWL